MGGVVTNALTAFGFFLLLSAIALVLFWAVTIRLDGAHGLDPRNFLVRWLGREKK